jgi:hypothetical protein
MKSVRNGERCAHDHVAALRGGAWGRRDFRYDVEAIDRQRLQAA